MTVQQSVRRVEYDANGALTTFSFPFRILASSHLFVNVRDSSGTDTLLSHGIDYSISAVGLAVGGHITATVAPALGKTVILDRWLPLLQLTDLRSAVPPDGRSIEDALDYQMMVSQQVSENFVFAPVYTTLPPAGPTWAGRFVRTRAGEGQMTQWWAGGQGSSGGYSWEPFAVIP